MLRVFPNPLTQSLTKSVPVAAGRGALRYPEHLNRRFARINSRSCIEEVELEHSQEGVDKALQDPIWFTATPDGWKRKNTDDIIHAALQALYFRRRIVACIVHGFFTVILSVSVAVDESLGGIPQQV